MYSLCVAPTLSNASCHTASVKSPWFSFSSSRSSKSSSPTPGSFLWPRATLLPTDIKKYISLILVAETFLFLRNSSQLPIASNSSCFTESTLLRAYMNPICCKNFSTRFNIYPFLASTSQSPSLKSKCSCEV